MKNLSSNPIIKVIANCHCLKCDTNLDFELTVHEGEYREILEQIHNGSYYFVPKYEYACIFCGEKVTAFKITGLYPAL